MGKFTMANLAISSTYRKHNFIAVGFSMETGWTFPARAKKDYTMQKIEDNMMKLATEATKQDSRCQ